MAYEKHTWECGEKITADKMNNLENGIEEALAGGGGGCGYECTETSTLLTEETVTTIKHDQSSPSAYASLSYSAPITADEIKLTLNGTEYVLPRKDAGGNNLYQGQDELPYVYSSQYGNNINTQDAETYALKIEAPSLSAETTPCFKEAVKSLIPSIPEDKLFVVQFVRTGDTLTSQTSYADVKKAAGDDSKYIVGRAQNGVLVFDGVLTGMQDEYGYTNYKFGFLNEYEISNEVEYISVLFKYDGTTETVIRKIAFAN